MYENIGEKIKILSKIIFYIQAIGSAIGGLAVMTMDANEETVLIGLLLLFLGPVLAWVSSWVLYGFGQLIDNTDKLVEFNEKKFDNADETPFEMVNEYEALELCKKCGADITNDLQHCHVCGEKKS